MKFLSIIALALAAFITMRLFKKQRALIFGIFTACVIVLNLLHSVRILDLIMPFYRPVRQTFYQEEFLEKGEYPDAILPLIIAGRDVYVKDDRISWDDLGGREPENVYWLYIYYHAQNALNWLGYSGAGVISDGSLNDAFVGSGLKSDFEELGIINDMFRNTCMLNDFWEELGNYFYYYWYYAGLCDEMHVYLNTDGLKEADRLVLLWQSDNGDESEDLYLMSYDYYESRIAGNAELHK